MKKTPNIRLFIGAAFGLALCAPLAADNDIAPIKRKPGSWSMKIIIEALEGDGIDAASKGKLQAMFDQAPKSICLTKAKAESEDFMGTVLRKGQPGTCNISKKDVVGDLLNLDMACVAPDKQGKMVPMAMSGRFSPVTNVMTISADKAPTPMGMAKMTMRSESYWAGECKPGEPEI